MSINSKWLKSLKISSKNEFQSWLMDEVGYETYLTNRLWDDASLLHYITITRNDNLYLKYLDKDDNVVEIDFSKKKPA